jgi:hypothetical protein
MEFSTQQKALIEKHREAATDYHWWDSTYDDFIRVAAAFGIPVAKDNISFSGFWSQGDGASFTTVDFNLAGILDAGLKTIQEGEYGKDPEQFEGYVLEFYHLYQRVFEKIGHHALLHPEGRQVAEAWCLHVWSNSRYCHSNTMCTDVGRFNAWSMIDDEAAEKCVGLDFDHFECQIRDALRSCADELYATLESEYDHITSDEQVWEMIVANGWDEEEGNEQAEAA